MSHTTRVAIIGTGISGLSAAYHLRDQPLERHLFDKGTNPGGRMATRTDRHDPTLRFEHGLQHIAPSAHPTLEPALKQWLTQGLLTPHPGTLGRLSAPGEHSAQQPMLGYAPTPDARTLAHTMLEMAAPTSSTQRAKVTALERLDTQQWRLHLEDQASPPPFDAIILTAPPIQSAALLQPHAPSLAAQTLHAQMSPRWIVMARFTHSLKLPYDQLTVSIEGSPLDKLTRQRPLDASGQERWTLLASQAWSIQHLEDSQADIAQALIQALHHALDQPLPPSNHVQAHRWRYGFTCAALPQSPLYDPELKLALAGDWTLGDRFEDAWISGQQAAQAIKTSLHA